MKLRSFKVTYKEWNNSFSGKIRGEMLAVGRNAEDAISRAKEKTDKDATDFEAWEIKSIMGYKIQVGEKAERNTTKTRKKEGRL